MSYLFSSILVFVRLIHVVAPTVVIAFGYHNGIPCKHVADTGCVSQSTVFHHRDRVNCSLRNLEACFLGFLLDTLRKTDTRDCLNLVRSTTSY